MVFPVPAIVSSRHLEVQFVSPQGIVLGIKAATCLKSSADSRSLVRDSFLNVKTLGVLTLQQRSWLNSDGCTTAMYCNRPTELHLIQYDTVGVEAFPPPNKSPDSNLLPMELEDLGWSEHVRSKYQVQKVVASGRHLRSCTNGISSSAMSRSCSSNTRKHFCR